MLVVVGEILKQDSKYNSYFADAVNRELRDIKLKRMMAMSVMIMMMNKFHNIAVVSDDDDVEVEEGEGPHLLDLALHIQHPSTERYTWGSSSVTIIVRSYDRSTLSARNMMIKKICHVVFHTLGLWKAAIVPSMLSHFTNWANLIHSLK